MTKKRRHLFAALGLAALAALLFGFLTWALVVGAVVANFPSDASIRSNTAGHSYMRPNTVYTREDNPGRYWLIVGLLGFFGTLFTAIAVLERRSYRISPDARKDEDPSPSLLAKIDRACGLYPEGRETLMRAKAALVGLNSPALETALDRLLEKILRAHDRKIALKEIQNLAKAMDLAGKF